MDVVGPVPKARPKKHGTSNRTADAASPAPSRAEPGPRAANPAEETLTPILGEAVPVGPLEAWRILTESDSTYVVVRRGESWWLAARNVPNPFSVAVPAGLWAIQRPEPWPPVLGGPLHLSVPTSLEFEDPRRMPGGGKNTSYVRAVGPLSGSKALAWIEKHIGPASEGTTIGDTKHAVDAEAPCRDNPPESRR